MKRGVGSVRVCGLILALISLFGLGVASAFGQAIDGSVVGTVVDTQGAAIVGAEVSATNIATNVGARLAGRESTVSIICWQARTRSR